MKNFRRVFSILLTAILAGPCHAQSSDTIICNFASPLPSFSYRGIHDTKEAYSLYFEDHVVMPRENTDDCIVEKIYIQFVVEQDGSLSNFKLIKGVDPILDQLAMEAAKLMPPWKPGKLKDKIVRSYVTVPVTLKYPPREM